ncbi:hypothetical protein PPYR_12155 [Photinus pyralis]|uniref:Major facilitator superfamily (MFS) profile domain-containing protein n=1 Tax=Photinus pyralis TaxID=7054 RepID=A0A5N4ADC0_PHOPY|nr:hypothetical protein PPYR_12155 [Photinus pyralis]
MVVCDISRICSRKYVLNLDILGALIALSDGMQLGWSSPMVPRLLLPSSPVPIRKSEVVWIENAYLLGGLVGLWFTVYLSNKIGRKGAILVGGCQSLLAWTIMSLSRDSWVLMLGRFIAGIGADINYVTTPMYIAEITHQSRRGRLGCTVFVMMHIGTFLVYVIGPHIPIVTTSVIGAAVCVIQLLTFSVMPESPYYLIMKGHDKEAKDCLRILRDSANLEEEFDAMRDAVKEETTSPRRLRDLFQSKSNRKGLLLTVVLNILQDFTGCTVIVMNLHTILSEFSPVGAPVAIIGIVFSIVLVISCATAGYLMDVVGRRKLLIVSCFLTSINLFAIAAYLTVNITGIFTPHLEWVEYASLIIYAIVQQNGVGVIPNVIPAELFPTNVRAYGCTAGDASFIIGSALSIFLYHFIVKYVGMDVPFYMFAICSLFAGIFSIFVVPETTGKTLYEIQTMLNAGGSRRKRMYTSESKRKLNSNSPCESDVDN